MPSSEDELGDQSDVGDFPESFLMDDNKEDYLVLRTPLRSLAGHGGVVIAADWLPGVTMPSRRAGTGRPAFGTQTRVSCCIS